MKAHSQPRLFECGDVKQRHSGQFKPDDQQIGDAEPRQSLAPIQHQVSSHPRRRDDAKSSLRPI